MKRSGAQFPQGSLDTLWTVGALGAMTDGELLDHFQVHRDTSGQEAFRILVQRHGPMVLGLCRSLLKDPHDAEDAFQATFLVLVRRAVSIQDRATLGPWLCGVTYRVARRAGPDRFVAAGMRSPSSLSRPDLPVRIATGQAPKRPSRRRSRGYPSRRVLRWSSAVWRD